MYKRSSTSAFPRAPYSQARCESRITTGWPAKSMDEEELQKVLFEEIFWEMKSKLTEEPERDLAV